MKKSAVLAVLVIALLLCASALLADERISAELVSAESGVWMTSYDNGNSIFTWTSSECWPNCEAILSIRFDGSVGGENWFELQGAQDQDPTVNQTVLNNTSTTWLDWHVDILNGLIDRVSVPVVHKVQADSSNWVIEYIHNAGYTDGFGARWIGGSTSVGSGDSLSVRFTWRPDGSGLPVTIHQYPTSTGEFIPEPSSMLALAGSLSTLGLALYRRKR